MIYCEKCMKSVRVKIILGDLNAKVVKGRNANIIGNCSLYDECAENCSFAVERTMAIRGTLFVI